MHLKRASSGKTVDTPAEECSPAAPWVTPSDLAAHAVRRCCCQGMLGACKAAGKRRPAPRGEKTDVAAAFSLRRASGGRLRRDAPREQPRLGSAAGRPRFNVRLPGWGGHRMKSRPQLLRGVIEAGQERLLPRCPHRVGRRHKQEGCVDLLGLLGRVAPPGMALGLRARAERAVSGHCAAGWGAPSPYRGGLVPPLGRDATHSKTRPTRSASAGNGLLETEARRGRRAGQTGAPWGLRGACGRAFRRAADGRRVLSAPRARRGRRGGRTAQLPSWLCGPPETSQAGSDPLASTATTSKSSKRRHLRKLGLAATPPAPPPEASVPATASASATTCRGCPLNTARSRRSRC